MTNIIHNLLRPERPSLAPKSQSNIRNAFSHLIRLLSLRNRLPKFIRKKPKTAPAAEIANHGRITPHKNSVAPAAKYYVPGQCPPTQLLPKIEPTSSPCDEIDDIGIPSSRITEEYSGESALSSEDSILEPSTAATTVVSVLDDQATKDPDDVEATVVAVKTQPSGQSQQIDGISAAIIPPATSRGAEYQSAAAVEPWPLEPEIEYDWNVNILPQIRQALNARQNGREACAATKNGDTIQLVARGTCREDITLSLYIITDRPALVKSALRECRIQARIPGLVIKFEARSSTRRFLRTADDRPFGESDGTGELQGSVPSLTNGIQAFGFCRGEFVSKVTFGGFVMLSGVPFALTAGHIGSGTAVPVQISSADTGQEIDPVFEPDAWEVLPWYEECDWVEWSPEDPDTDADTGTELIEQSPGLADYVARPQQQGSNENAIITDGKQGISPSSAFERIDFRMNRDPNSSLIGISIVETGGGASGSVKKFSDDWQLVIPGAGFNLERQETIKGVLTEDEIPNRNVILLRPGGKEIYGRVSAASNLLQLPGDRYFSRAWSMELLQPSARGVSGAWIVDQERNLVGQLAASVSGLNIAYFIPAAQIFSRIQRRFPGFPIEVLKSNGLQSDKERVRSSLFADMSRSRPLTSKLLRDKLRIGSTLPTTERTLSKGPLYPFTPLPSDYAVSSRSSSIPRNLSPPPLFFSPTPSITSRPASISLSDVRNYETSISTDNFSRAGSRSQTMEDSNNPWAHDNGSMQSLVVYPVAMKPFVYTPYEQTCNLKQEASGAKQDDIEEQATATSENDISPSLSKFEQPAFAFANGVDPPYMTTSTHWPMGTKPSKDVDKRSIPPKIHNDNGEDPSMLALKNSTVNLRGSIDMKEKIQHRTLHKRHQL